MSTPRVCVALLAYLCSWPATDAMYHHLRHNTLAEPVVATLALNASKPVASVNATVAFPAASDGSIPTRPHWEVPEPKKEEVHEETRHAEPEHTEEKHEEHHEEKHDHEAVHESAGYVVAVSFMATIALFSTAFSMANSDDDKVKNYTLVIIDNCVAILLAVMYFQAVDGYMNYAQLVGHHASLAAIVHAIAYLAGALIVAACLRDNAVFLAIFCGAGAHVVSFTSIHASAKTQNSVWMAIDYHPIYCLIGLVCLAVALAGIGFVVYKLKEYAHLADDDAFMDKTDDLENDFGAMGFSVCFTMLIRFLITGHHPVDDDTEFDHTQTQRNLMLLNGFVMLVLAIPIVAYCSRQSDAASKRGSYFWKRVWTFVGSVATLNVTWAFLYWGEWEFYGHMFGSESPILGRIAWAVVASIAGCFGVYGLSNVTGDKIAHVVSVALAALGLVVAFSWEVCFDAAIDSMLEDSEYSPGHVKMACTLIMAAFILPMYAKHLKPLSMKAAEAIGG